MCHKLLVDTKSNDFIAEEIIYSMSKHKILSRWRRPLTQCLETRALILDDHKHLDIHNLAH